MPESFNVKLNGILLKSLLCSGETIFATRERCVGIRWRMNDVNDGGTEGAYNQRSSMLMSLPWSGNAC